MLAAGTVAHLAAQSIPYQSFENDPMHVRIYTLDNGLKVYISVNHDEPRIQTLIAVRAGSTYDPDDATGLAHYLEHMMFKGTSQIATVNWPEEQKLLQQISNLYEQHRNEKNEAKKKAIYHQIDSLSGVAAQYACPNEYDKMVSSIGATGTNAYTSDERTVYINDIPSNELEKWAFLESERFSQLVLRLFHTELETVFEEFNRGQDNDMTQLWQTLFKTAFKKHGYGTHTTIGRGEDLKNPSMVKIHEFFDKYYVPNNMAICLAGDLNPDEAIQVINKYFGKLKPGEVSERTFPKEKKIKKPIKAEVWGPQAPQVVLAWRMDGFNSKESQMIDLINAILNNGQAGLVDIDLLQDQKVLNAWTYAYRLRDYSLHIFSGSPREGQTLDDVRDLLLAEIEKLKNGDFEEWLVKAAVNNLKLDLMRQMESNSARASMMVDAFIMGTPWPDYINEINELEKITKQDIVDFAKKHYGNNYVIVYKRQGENKNKLLLEKPEITPLMLNRDQQSDFATRFYQMTSQRLSPVFVDYRKDLQRYPLNSGMEFYYIPNTTNQLFELYYVLDLGKDNDKKLALAVEYLPYLGTDKYTARQLQEEFFKLGLSMDVSTGRDRIYVSLSGLEENMEKGIELLEHVLRHVQPNQQAYEDMVDGKLKERENNKHNKNQILYGALFNYAQHVEDSPFRDIISEKELRSIDPQELVDLIHNLVNYKHRILYYGTRSPEQVRNVLDRFHTVPVRFKQAPPRKKYPEPPIVKNKVLFVNYDMVQVELLLVARDELFDVSNIPYARLFNNYFGSGLSSIFFQDIREARALAYAAYCAFISPGEPGKHHYFFSYVGTQNDKLPDAMPAVLELLNNMPHADQQFESARESVMKNIETNRITKTDIFWDYLKAEKMGIDHDIRQDIYKLAGQATLDDLQAFFDKHIKGKKYVYCVIGNRDLVDMDYLKSLGDFEEVDLETLFNY